MSLLLSLFFFLSLERFHHLETLFLVSNFEQNLFQCDSNTNFLH